MRVKQQLDKITMDEVCDIISRAVKLHPEKVRDVFQEYENLYMYAVKNKKRLCLGNIGQFLFDYREGKKKGTIVNSFAVDEEKTAKLGLTAKNLPRMKAVKAVMEEDKPNYMRSIFEVYKVKQAKVRELTEQIDYNKK